MKATNRIDPSVNGVPQKKPKKARKRKGEPFEEGGIKIVPVSQEQEPQRGRLASDLRPRGVEWLLAPWIPKGMLSLVVGLPAVGKSTFMAWLTAQAGCAAVMPGFEEEVEVTTLPRLQANGVRLSLVRFLDDREYRLPRDKSRIASILRGWEAELLVIDPIDSYMEDEMNENTGRDVRSMLESVAWIASQTGAAVVGVRHPGKDRTNVMPGSRQWRAVPRSIVELATDGNVPPRLLLRHYKDSLGQDARPRRYRLEGDRGAPRKFVLEDELDVSLSRLSEVESDPTERIEIRKVGRYVRHLFTANDKPLVADLMSICRANGVADRARRQAVNLLSIDEKPDGVGGKYIMFGAPATWPAWTDDPQS